MTIIVNSSKEGFYDNDKFAFISEEHVLGVD